MNAIYPMLLTELHAVPRGGFLYQIKYDGERAIAKTDSTTTTITNRRGAAISKRYPELAELHTALPPHTTIDGEICVFDDGKDRFNLLAQRAHLTNPFMIKLRSRRLPVTFMAFDILEYAGEDLRQKPLTERLDILKGVLKGIPHYKVVDSYEDGEALFKKTKDDGNEGIVAKKKDSPYVGTIGGRRSGYWVKIKHKQREVLKVLGYTESNNQTRLMRAVTTELGEVGSGFTEQDLFTIKTRLDNREEVFIECEYQELSENRKMRFPVFIRVVENEI